MGGGKTRLQMLDEKQSPNLIKIVAGSAHRLLDNGAKLARGKNAEGLHLKNGANIAIFNAPDALFADVIAQPHARAFCI